jgi:hypothetical protein
VVRFELDPAIDQVLADRVQVQHQTGTFGFQSPCPR